MDEIKYIVAPNKSIATKIGIIGPGIDVSPKIIGPNFNALVEKGLIIKKEDLEFKNDVEKQEIEFAKSEKIEPEPDSIKEDVKIEKEEKELTKKEIKELLKEKNIEFNDRANKNDLLKLLDGDKKPEFGAKKTEENE